MVYNQKYSIIKQRWCNCFLANMIVSSTSHPDLCDFGGVAHSGSWMMTMCCHNVSALLLPFVANFDDKADDDNDDDK